MDDRNAQAKPEYVISMDVDCPWCKAKAGEPCYMQGYDGHMYRSDREGHFMRVKKADAANRLAGEKQ